MRLKEARGVRSRDRDGYRYPLKSWLTRSGTYSAIGERGPSARCLVPHSAVEILEGSSPG